MIKSMLSVVAQSLLRIFFSILSLKIVAYYTGPSGMMMYGQLQSFTQIAGATTSSVTSAGVVKLIAEKQYSKKDIISGASLLLIIYSILIFIIFTLSSGFVRGNIISNEWMIVFMLIPLGSFFVGKNNLVVSILNGEQDFRGFFIFSVVNSFFISFLTVILCFFLYKKGAIYSIVLSPVGAFFFSIFFVNKIKDVFFCSFSIFFENTKLIISLLQYSFMAIFSAVIVYGTQIYIRHLISIDVSIESAGIWFSATKLSEVYMGIVSVLFSSILIPRFTMKKGKHLTGDVRVFLYIAILLGCGLIVGIYLLSPFMVSIIYGDRFNGVSHILFLYSIGDALKILTLVFLYLVISKKHLRFYFFYEMTSSILYFIFCTYGLKLVGFKFMALGYPLQSLVSLIIISIWYIFTFNKVAEKNA